jgi:hypothetical protein
MYYKNDLPKEEQLDAVCNKCGKRRIGYNNGIWKLSEKLSCGYLGILEKKMLKLILNKMYTELNELRMLTNDGSLWTQ